MKTSLLCLLLVGLLAAAQAQPVDWQCIQAKQPPGLELRLELPKTEFYQGEIIEATVTFASTSPELYRATNCGWDRSGRDVTLKFVAWDGEGKRGRDPLDIHRYFRGGGPSQSVELGTFTKKHIVNEWVSFLTPGEYTLVVGGSVYPDTLDSNGQRPSIPLVSKPLTIRIRPQEPLVVEHVVARILADDSTMKDDVQLFGDVEKQENKKRNGRILRHLGTPASRIALRNWGGEEFYFACYGAPDRSQAAAEILADIETGKLNGTKFADLYATLIAGDPALPGTRRHLVCDPCNPPYDAQAEQQNYMAFETRKEEALRRFHEAAFRRGGPKGGSDYTAALIDRLQFDDRERDNILEELAKIQLELPREQQQQLAGRVWRTGGEPFLPMLRALLAGPKPYLRAFEVLINYAPAEARAFLVTSITSGDWLEWESHVRADLFELPPQPIPELDKSLAALLGRLAGDEPYLDEVLKLTCRYGTPTLLPDLASVYTQHRRKIRAQSDCLHFWITHDPEQGYAALALALTIDYSEKIGYPEFLEHLFGEEIDPPALPLVTGAITSSNQHIACDAIQLLARHGDPAWLEPSITALEGMKPMMPSPPEGFAPNSKFWTRDQSPRFNAAGRILNPSGHQVKWKPDDDQRRRLVAILSQQPVW